jgi:hypothetical protein
MTDTKLSSLNEIGTRCFSGARNWVLTFLLV